MSWEVIHGDCLDVMRGMEAESVDAMVCDPPYGLEFMGKDWDKLTSSFKASKGKGLWAEQHNTTRKGFDGYSPMPSYTKPDANVRCPNCKNWRDGRDPLKPDKRKGYRCVCGGAQREQRRVVANAMQEWHYAWAVEALRVAKPGAHLLALGGTRTHHRLMSAIEDAGWEIRDCIMWLYGSGFPKSLDVSKAIDKEAGAERESTGPVVYAEGHIQNHAGGRQGYHDWKGEGVHEGTAPATDAAKQWDGWGTALKPAAEIIVLARKPLIGTVAANVLEHGTGGLNIDGCRVEGQPETTRFNPAKHTHDGWRMKATGDECAERAKRNRGRWPANVAHDGSEEVVGLFPQTTSRRSDTPQPIKTSKGHTGGAFGNDSARKPAGHPVHESYVRGGFDDSGSAARFFYTAKASRVEREAGLEGMVRRNAGVHDDDGYREPGERKADHTAPLPTTNHHPTVKPIALMRWLCRLVTPPNGLILDPFCGSGSTGVAASLEGFRFIGIDIDAEYCEIARKRITAANEQTDLFTGCTAPQPDTPAGEAA